MAQGVYGRSRSRVASHHQPLDAMLGNQEVGNGVRALEHMVVIAVAIGRVPIVGHVDKALQRQLGLQRAQHAQAAYTAVKYAYGAHAGCGPWLPLSGRSPGCS